MKAKKFLCMVLCALLISVSLPAAALADTTDVEGTITPTTLVTGSESATVYNVNYGAADVIGSGSDPYKTFYGVQYQVTVTKPGILEVDAARVSGNTPIYIGLVTNVATAYRQYYYYMDYSPRVPDNQKTAYFQVQPGTYYLRFCSMNNSTDVSVRAAAYLFTNEDRTLSSGRFAAAAYKEGGTYYKMVLPRSGNATIAVGDGDDVSMTLCNSSKNAIKSAVTLSDTVGLSKTYALPAGTYYIKVVANRYVPPVLSGAIEGNRTFVYRVKYTFAPTDIRVTKITLNKTLVTIKKGSTYTLKATVSPSNATNKGLSWKSSNTKVATVSSSGKVTAKGKGSCSITVTAKDGSGKKATCKVTVGQPVTKVTLNKTIVTLKKGSTYTLKATVAPSNATNKGLSWKSSNTKVATVSSSGKVTAKGKGSCTITATAKDGSGKKATCKVTVGQPVTRVTLNKTGITLKKGKTYTLKATVSPSNATNKGLSWKSSNTKVATVSSSGKVTAKGKGSCSITATAKDGSGKKVTCKVTVK